jgi:hypothetical protein
VECHKGFQDPAEKSTFKDFTCFLLFFHSFPFLAF